MIREAFKEIGFSWDWMVFPHAGLIPQLIFDIFFPLLIVFLGRNSQFYMDESPLVEDDPSYPRWVRNLWKYILAALYLWFFTATIWDFFIAPH